MFVPDAECLPPGALGNLDPGEVVLTKTADRQVLGAMNDHVVLVEHMLGDRGGRRARPGELPATR